MHYQFGSAHLLNISYHTYMGPARTPPTWAFVARLAGPKWFHLALHFQVPTSATVCIATGIGQDPDQRP